MKYIYGEDIKYGYDLIKPNDFEKLQIFKIMHLISIYTMS